MSKQPLILIVEDEPIVAKDLERSLRGMGYAVAGIVGSARKAIDSAGALRPDLALMDIRLEGGSDGIEAAGTIRRRFGIPIVFLTAYADEKTLKRAKEIGPFGYLTKPFGDRELQTAIGIALQMHDLEKTLRESREWSMTILRSIGEGVITTDFQGCISFMNPRAETLTGWKQEEAMGKEFRSVFHSVDEDTRKAWDLQVAGPPARRRGEKTTPRSLVLVSKGGVEAPIECHVSSVPDDGGSPLGAVVVFHDVRVRRLMENRLISDQRMGAIGKLAGTIANDFGNILKSITDHASSALENLLPGTRAYDDTTKVIEAARAGNDLTKRILTVSRASVRDGKVRVGPVSLSQAFAAAVAGMEHSFAEHRVTVNVQAPDKMPWVTANLVQLADVLMDLFMNAVQAMPSGGAITVEAGPTSATPPEPLTAPKGRHYVALTVRDTGIGISKDVMHRMFEPFFTTRSASGSMGLGLSIVRGTIQQYGGWVEVASEPGMGASFTLFLPRARITRTSGSAAGSSAAGLTVLLVDDRADFLAEIGAMLERDGHQVVRASGGDEGIALYRDKSREIDLAIVDAIMVGTPGREVVRVITEMNDALPMVLMSGFSRDYVRSVIPPGTWCYVQKPFDQEQLRAAIHRALSQASGQS